VSIDAIIVGGNMAIIVKNDRIQIDRLELGPFGTNSYILICQKTNESVVVDAPGEAGMVVFLLELSN
jgi:glyoxylase-like metal-dependent hydrolase (beta-lactamase superfamily II)